MKKSALILLLLSFMGCTTEQPNDLSLFNDLSFRMEPGESLAKITRTAKDRYAQYFNNQFVQVPLFKNIKHPNYEIFIGIPYNTSLEAIIEFQLKNPDSTTVDLKYDSLNFYKKYKKNDFFITEYVRKDKNKSLVFISTLCESSELTDSLFSEQQLSNRITNYKR